MSYTLTLVLICYDVVHHGILQVATSQKHCVTMHRVHNLVLHLSNCPTRSDQAYHAAHCLTHLLQHHGKIDDVMMWFDELMLGAEVLPLEAAQQLMLSKREVLAEQQRQWERQARAEQAAQQLQSRCPSASHLCSLAVSSDAFAPWAPLL